MCFEDPQEGWELQELPAFSFLYPPNDLSAAADRRKLHSVKYHTKFGNE